jgi:hypothetical protein
VHRYHGVCRRKLQRSSENFRAPWNGSQRRMERFAASKSACAEPHGFAKTKELMKFTAPRPL